MRMTSIPGRRGRRRKGRRFMCVKTVCAFCGHCDVCTAGARPTYGAEGRDDVLEEGGGATGARSSERTGAHGAGGAIRKNTVMKALIAEDNARRLLQAHVQERGTDDSAGSEAAAKKRKRNRSKLSVDASGRRTLT